MQQHATRFALHLPCPALQHPLPCCPASRALLASPLQPPQTAAPASTVVVRTAGGAREPPARERAREEVRRRLPRSAALACMRDKRLSPSAPAIAPLLHLTPLIFAACMLHPGPDWPDWPLCLSCLDSLPSHSHPALPPPSRPLPAHSAQSAPAPRLPPPPPQQRRRRPPAAPPRPRWLFPWSGLPPTVCWCLSTVWSANPSSTERWSAATPGATPGYWARGRADKGCWCCSGYPAICVGSFLVVG
jgi:hypothetical protein